MSIIPAIGCTLRHMLCKFWFQCIFFIVRLCTLSEVLVGWCSPYMIWDSPCQRGCANICEFGVTICSCGWSDMNRCGHDGGKDSSRKIICSGSRKGNTICVWSCGGLGWECRQLVGDMLPWQPNDGTFGRQLPVVATQNWSRHSIFVSEIADIHPFQMIYIKKWTYGSIYLG